jgi:hypothetical protein
MKKEPLHSQSQPQSSPTRHQFDHAVPTVIHHPEEEMTILGRWVHRALEDPTQLWGMLGGIVAVVLAVVLVGNFLSLGSSQSDVWAKLEMAKTPAERLKLAEDYPNSPAASWARLQAATEFYNQGFADLPNNRDVALPVMKKALDLFDRVAGESPKDSPQARAAALGKARTLEARNELSKAIEQYHFVEKTWPGTPEADIAKQLAAALQKPDAASFYKELYAYQPTKVTLPPLGSENVNFPLVPAPGMNTLGTGDAKGATPPFVPLLPPPPPRPVNKAESTAPQGSGVATDEPTNPVTSSQPAAALPELPFASGDSTPKTQPAPSIPKVDAPKTEPKPTATKPEAPQP